MSTSILANILDISGQVVNTIEQQDTGEIVISCKRDKRTKVIDPVSKLKISINLYIHRTIKNIDKRYLQETLPALDQSTLTDLKCISPS